MTSGSRTRIFTLGFVLVTLLSGACSRNVVDSSQPRPGSAPETRISPDGVNAAEPAVAASTAGELFAVYVEHLPDDGADVYINRFDDSGKPAGDRVRVNTIAGEAKAWRGDPPTIAVGRDNTVYVGWTRRYRDKDAKGNDLMLSVSRDGGQSFSPPVKVNDDVKPASHGMHSLAVTSDGRVVMAWLDERGVGLKKHEEDDEHHMSVAAPGMHHDEAEPNSEVYLAFSRDGGKSFSANKRIATEVCPCCKTSLLAAADGTLYAGWRQVLAGDHRHIAVAHSTDGGETFSAGVTVSDDNWQINACPVSGAALASPSHDTLDVLWYTAGAAGQAGLYTTRSTDGGKSFTSRTLVSADASSGTPILIEAPGRASTAIFSLRDDRVGKAAWQVNPGDSLERTTISDATLPSATTAAGRAVTAFVRRDGEKTSVWVN